MPNTLPSNHEPIGVEPPEDFFKRQPRAYRIAHRVGELWRKRPDMFEMHFYYIPVALSAAALAIGVADKELNLHLAKDMASVHVGKHDGAVDQLFEGIIHDVGTEAVKVEK